MSGSDEELRGRVDAEGGQKRYQNSDRGQTPEEIDDPTTQRDGTTPTLWQTAKQNYLYFLTLLLAGIAAVIVAAAFGVRLVPELLANRLLLGGVALSIVLVGVYVVATKAAYGRVISTDWFVGITGTSIHFYMGEYVVGGPDETARFHPYKGFSLFGHKREPYTVAEISPDAAHTWKHPEIDGDDPASMNIDEAPGGVLQTEYGTIVGRWMGGIEPQPKGDAQLRVTPPEKVDPEQFNMLSSQLKKKARRARFLTEELDARDEYIENELDSLKQPVDKQVDKELTRAAFLARIGTRPRQDQRGDIRLSDVDGVGTADALEEFATDGDGENGGQYDF